MRLSFTTAVGTASCGNAGLTTPPASPLSGELDSDTGCTTKLADLGLGCLYFGGGNATVVAGGKIPDGATSFLDVSGPGTLSGSAGTSEQNCTLGAGPGKHCVNNNTLPACTADGDCGGAAGSCALDANCYFGPPLPIVSPAPFASLTTCVINAVQTTASGTFDASSGGLGGCPYAPGASGNMATEDLVYMLDAMAIETGVDLKRLVKASSIIAPYLDHPLPGRYLQACTRAVAPVAPGVAGHPFPPEKFPSLRLPIAGGEFPRRC